MADRHSQFGSAAKLADTESGTSKLTQHLWSEWQQTNQTLSDLAREEDRLITNGEEVPEELEAEVTEACDLMRKIILDALSIRAESLEDIGIKLTIWQSYNFGDSVKPHLLQPSDLLIRQSIRELNEIRKKY